MWRDWLYLEMPWKHWACSNLSFRIFKIISTQLVHRLYKGDRGIIFVPLYLTHFFILNYCWLNQILSLLCHFVLSSDLWSVVTVTLWFYLPRGAMVLTSLDMRSQQLPKIPEALTSAPHVLVTCFCVLTGRFHSKVWRMNHTMMQIFSAASWPSLIEITEIQGLLDCLAQRSGSVEKLISSI